LRVVSSAFISALFCICHASISRRWSWTASSAATSGPISFRSGPEGAPSQVILGGSQLPHDGHAFLAVPRRPPPRWGGNGDGQAGDQDFRRREGGQGPHFHNLSRNLCGIWGRVWGRPRVGKRPLTCCDAGGRWWFRTTDLRLVIPGMIRNTPGQTTKTIDSAAMRSDTLVRLMWHVCGTRPGGTHRTGQLRPLLLVPLAQRRSAGPPDVEVRVDGTLMSCVRSRVHHAARVNASGAPHVLTPSLRSNARPAGRRGNATPERDVACAGRTISSTSPNPYGSEVVVISARPQASVMRTTVTRAEERT
jgi:hypothetical protein